MVLKLDKKQVKNSNRQLAALRVKAEKFDKADLWLTNGGGACAALGLTVLLSGAGFGNTVLQVLGAIVAVLGVFVFIASLGPQLIAAYYRHHRDSLYKAIYRPKKVKPS